MGLNIVVWILSFVLGVPFLLLGVLKLVQENDMVQGRDHLGIKPTLHRLIGAAESIGAFGLVIGAVANGTADWIGLAAATGLLFLTASAVVLRYRAGDAFNEIIPALVMALLCLSYLLASATRSMNDTAAQFSAILIL